MADRSVVQDAHLIPGASETGSPSFHGVEWLSAALYKHVYRHLRFLVSKPAVGPLYRFLCGFVVCAFRFVISLSVVMDALRLAALV